MKNPGTRVPGFFNVFIEQAGACLADHQIAGQSHYADDYSVYADQTLPGSALLFVLTNKFITGHVDLLSPGQCPG